MEPILPNDADEAEMMRKMRDMDGLPPEEKGISKKRKVQIVAAGLGLLALIALLFFLLAGGKPESQAKGVSAVNRGLMQAEAIRKQKDQLDDKGKRKNTEEDEWVKRFQAMREHPASEPPAPVPDPVPMFPQGMKPEQDPAGVRPSNPKEAGGGWKNPVAFPSSQAPEGMEAAKPVGFKTPSVLESRMSEEYQKALAYNSSEQLVFTRDRARDERKEAPGGKGAPKPVGMTNKVILSAGDEIRAVLTESINSDYPSVAKATLTSPSELSGATLLLSYSLGNERVTAQVLKLILPAKEGERAREQNLAAVVKSGLPGLAGDVNHHWTSQVTAGIASAGLTAGALAYAAKNSNPDLGTAVLVSPLIEQSVQGVLKPINYLGRDRPVTVTVPAGTEFTLLVTEGLEVEL